MRIAKRIFLFASVNILIVTTLSIVTSLLGIQPYLEASGINYGALVIFCLFWGFGGAGLSLLMSRQMAKWMMGVKLVEPQTSDPTLRKLVTRVHELARKAGITVMPEVGYYEGDELNAFATGPSRNRALVAVSTGLLNQMDENELDGVLAHEVAHIANGDMVTMTLIQGVANALVMFIARVAAMLASQFVAEERRPMVQFGVTIALELVLGMLGMIVVNFFSRQREYKADEGGARLSTRTSMIAALERLKLNTSIEETEGQAAVSTLKISGKAGGLLSLFSTHPDLADRIDRLKGLSRAQ